MKKKNNMSNGVLSQGVDSPCKCTERFAHKDRTVRTTQLDGPRLDRGDFGSLMCSKHESQHLDKDIQKSETKFL